MTNGTIKSINGQIIQVEFFENHPKIHDILVLEGNDLIKMEVYSSSAENTFFCLALTDTSSLHRGAKMINTMKSIEIPVGNEVLGRIMNVFGEAQDGKEPMQVKEKK